MIKDKGERSLIGDIFIEHYRAFKAEIFGREDIELSNNVILPSSALKIFDMKSLCHSKNPILFRISNLQRIIYTHCGVLDFTAENDKCYLPSNMFDQLCLEEGQYVTIRPAILKPGTFIKIKPHKSEMLTIPYPKAFLEYNLRNYFCLTEGDTISLKFGRNIYKIDIIQCKPSKAIRTLNTDIEVDFSPPKDYEESNINILNQFTILELIDPKDISKLDEKKTKEKNDSNQQSLIFKEEKFQKNNEENYDPRNCRIDNNPRPDFKNVDI